MADSDGTIVCKKCKKHIMDLEDAVVIAKVGDKKPTAFLCLECFEEEYSPFMN